MGEVYLSWDDICTFYPDEWVLIARPTDSRRADDVLGGRVIAHSPHQHDVDRATDLAPPDPNIIMLHTDREWAVEAPDFVRDFDYMMWRPIFMEDESEGDALPLPAVAYPVRKWWQFWR